MLRATAAHFNQALTLMYAPGLSICLQFAGGEKTGVAEEEEKEKAVKEVITSVKCKRAECDLGRPC